MADSEESNNILIQSLKETAKNKNTQQSTKWIKVWITAMTKEEYEPKALNKILEEFQEQFERKAEKITSLIIFFSCISNHMIFSRNLK